MKKALTAAIAVFIYVCGYIHGRTTAAAASLTSPSSSHYTYHTSQLSDIPSRPVNHAGSDVQTRSLLPPDARARPSPLVSLSVATFKPHDSVEEHAHHDMHELFFVMGGTSAAVEFTLQGEKVVAVAGTLVAIAPGTKHALRNVGSETELLYFGIV